MRSFHPRRARRWHVLQLFMLPACLPWTPAFAAAPTACSSCHMAPPVTTALASECALCHRGEQTVTAPAITATELVETAPDTATMPARSSDKPLPGMSVPMYYEESRIGTQPNAMSLIPAGPFTMGTDERLPDEGPAHTVTLPDYYMDTYEVTNGQYKAFIDATGHKSPAHFENRTYPPGKIDHPVVGVTWNDARDYCTWAGKRLPSDAEWEKAARGTDARRYPWGDDFGLNRANNPQYWASLDREGDTSPVGAFAEGVSPYGLYDMSGNVWEWTDSWYQAYPGNTHPNENYGEHYKTLKGGSWWDCSFYKCGISAPSFNRAFFLRTTRNISFGFRCAKDAP